MAFVSTQRWLGKPRKQTDSEESQRLCGYPRGSSRFCAQAECTQPASTRGLRPSVAEDRCRNRFVNAITPGTVLARCDRQACPFADAAASGTRRAATASPLAPVVSSCTASGSGIHQGLGPRRAGRQAPPLTCCASLAAGHHRQGACSFRRCKARYVLERRRTPNRRTIAGGSGAAARPCPATRSINAGAGASCVCAWSPMKRQLQLIKSIKSGVATKLTGRGFAGVSPVRQPLTPQRAIAAFPELRQNVWKLAKKDCALAPLRYQELADTVV